MGTAAKTPWEGRLGIEFIGKMKGCCARAILKWRPQTIGQKTTCSYCGSMMKTIRAGEVLSHLFTGGMLEEKAAAAEEEPEIVIGGLYFSTEKFASQEAVKTWMAEREITSDAVIEIDEHAFYVPLERLLPESVRAIWVASGVVGEIGVAKQVATGGGQASMSSPGITMASMASGGTAHPAQGPETVVAGAVPTLLHGMTDVQDGHQHEYSLVPIEDASGRIVRGFTTFDHGHTHMIEAALTEGGFEARTAPDQSPVGGHAHSHRVSFSGGVSSTMKSLDTTPAGEAPKKTQKQMCKVNTNDLNLLAQASKSLKTFCKNALGERETNSDFQAQLSQAIERARGIAGASGEVEMDKDDLKWLKDASEYMENLGSALAKSLIVEEAIKAVGVEKAKDVSAVCGYLWFHGTDAQREGFGDGTEGRGREEKAPKAWWDHCVATIEESGSKKKE